MYEFGWMGIVLAYFVVVVRPGRVEQRSIERRFELVLWRGR